ncbi:MAG: class I tRNA ligase family protein [Comamonadaceae bacterium]|nr:class I tRNA ligase family protein [Comamonadaceae bacterium]
MRRLGDTRRLVARVLHDGRQALDASSSRPSCGCTSEGLIYRGKRLVNWDPVLQIGGVRPRGRERGGGRLPLAHPLPAGGRLAAALVVATTRPETMLGDTAVMVHPEDERYAALVGKRVQLPLTRPHDPGHRRRLRRPRVRHRRA